MDNLLPTLFVGSGVTLSDKALAAFPAPHLRVRTHTDIPAHVEGVVLVVTAHEIRMWLDNTSASSSVIVIWTPVGEAIEPELLHHPRVAGVLDPACSPATVYATLKSATVLAQRHSQHNAAQMLEQVLQIGRALASEKDLDTLLSLILTYARSLTASDGASIYTFNADKRLCFRLWQNASATMDAGQLPVGEDSISGYVARTGAPLVIEDAYELPPNAPYRFNSSHDRSLGYRTRSLLTVPLKNKGGQVLGVLQLINRKLNVEQRLVNAEDCLRYVRPFSAQDQIIADALAGQAGVALENSLLYADIERLFEGFIKASVQAIEARDPVTAGHSFRVAEFTEQLAKAVDRCEQHGLRDVMFSKVQLRELRYAALLHDFGKVGVKEEVLLKSKKLYPLQFELLKQRFKYARAQAEKAAYRKLLDLQTQRGLTAAELTEQRQALEHSLAQEAARLERYWQIVAAVNEPSIVRQEVPSELREIAAFRFSDDDGSAPLLQPVEFGHLTLGKGSLNPEERAQIESHVSHTYTFLSLIPWTKDLAFLPEIAYSHHEKIDGSGYPRGLAGQAIPVQSKMMTIADIYDALTAGDRPYKRALPPEKALDILQEEVRHKKIDGDILRVFIEAEAYRLRA